MRRYARVLARRQDDAKPGAGIEIDVRIDAALADQLELRQALQEWRANLRALAEQYQRLGIAQAIGEDVSLLHVIGPDRDIVAVKLVKARQRAQRVVIVVENGNFHRSALVNGSMPPSLLVLRTKRKPGPCGPGSSSPAWGRQRLTFQRGTKLPDITIADLGG